MRSVSNIIRRSCSEGNPAAPVATEKVFRYGNSQRSALSGNHDRRGKRITLLVTRKFSGEVFGMVAHTR